MKKIITIISVLSFFIFPAISLAATESFNDACAPYSGIVNPFDPINIQCDLNHDGFVDGDDYTIADNAFNTGNPILITLPTPQAPVASADASTPSGFGQILPLGEPLASCFNPYSAFCMYTGSWTLYPNPNFK